MLPCGTKFLRVLIFAIFDFFPSRSAKKVPAKKDTAKVFSPKVYSTVEIMCKHHLLHVM